MPHSLLGPTGYLPLKQQNIDTIRLVTDGSCGWNEERKHHLALSAFPNLRRLSWIGLASNHDLRLLNEVLRRRGHQLKDLELDLVYRWDLRNSLRNNLTMMDLAKGSTHSFPALTSLTLSGVSLWPWKVLERDMRNFMEHLHCVFDFRQMRSLKLRFCPHWDGLFAWIAASDPRIELKTLELHSCIQNESFDEHPSILRLLQCTQGLEELFLHTRSNETLTYH